MPETREHARVAVVGLWLGAACSRDASPRWLVIDEAIELCAVAPYSTPVADLHATHWRIGFEAGAYLLPEPQPLEHPGAVAAVSGAPMPALFDVRDVDGASPLDDEQEVAVIEDADVWLEASEGVDVLVASSSLPAAFGERAHVRLLTDADTGADFRIDAAAEVGFGCSTDVAPCRARAFDACDPGGETVRTVVTLDRGEVVLDVRTIERNPLDGDPTRVVFVASEVHLDDVVVVQHDFFHLLHAARSSSVGDGSYIVLAPEALDAAGLGCGVAVTDIGGDAPRASVVDCSRTEIAPLAIGDIAREVLP